MSDASRLCFYLDIHSFIYLFSHFLIYLFIQEKEEVMYQIQSYFLPFRILLFSKIVLPSVAFYANSGGAKNLTRQKKKFNKTLHFIPLLFSTLPQTWMDTFEKSCEGYVFEIWNNLSPRQERKTSNWGPTNKYLSIAWKFRGTQTNFFRNFKVMASRFLLSFSLIFRFQHAIRLIFGKQKRRKI